MEAEEDEQTGRNEDEPNPMSLDKHRTGDKPSCCTIGEGRREEAGQQSLPSQRSGGVGVDGTFVSSVKVSWENSGVGRNAQPTAQAGNTSEAEGAAGVVGVLRSSEEAPVMGVERRRDTCPGVRSDGGRWLRQEIRRHEVILINPDFGSRPKGANRTGLGEPNMGDPSVRFDEGRSDSAGLTTAVGSKPPPATSPTLPTNQSRVPKSVVNVIMRMKELYLEPRWGEIRNMMIDRSLARKTVAAQLNNWREELLEQRRQCVSHHV